MSVVGCLTVFRPVTFVRQWFIKCQIHRTGITNTVASKCMNRIQREEKGNRLSKHSNRTNGKTIKFRALFLFASLSGRFALYSCAVGRRQRINLRHIYHTEPSSFEYRWDFFSTMQRLARRSPSRSFSRAILRSSSV